jgi:hypothetical protein
MAVNERISEGKRETAEMRVLRQLAGCGVSDHKANEDIRQELEIL